MKNKNFAHTTKSTKSNSNLSKIVAWVLLAVMTFCIVGSTLGIFAFGKSYSASADSLMNDYVYQGSNVFVPYNEHTSGFTPKATANFKTFSFDIAFKRYDSTITLGGKTKDIFACSPTVHATPLNSSSKLPIKYVGDSNYYDGENHLIQWQELNAKSVEEINNETLLTSSTYFIDNFGGGNSPTGLYAGTYYFDIMTPLQLMSMSGYNSYKSYYFNFKCGNDTYSYIKVKHTVTGNLNADEHWYIYYGGKNNTSTETTVYSTTYEDVDTNGWLSESYRTINVSFFQSDSNAIISAKNVLYPNATNLTYTYSVTDLSNSRWILKPNASVSGDYGVFILNDTSVVVNTSSGASITQNTYSLNNNAPYLFMGYKVVDDNGQYLVDMNDNSFALSTSIDTFRLWQFNSYVFTFGNNNDDNTNSRLISWLLENARLDLTYSLPLGLNDVYGCKVDYTMQLGFDCNVSRVEFTHNYDSLSSNEYKYIINTIRYFDTNDYFLQINFTSVFNKSDFVSDVHFEERTYYLNTDLTDNQYYQNGLKDGISTGAKNGYDKGYDKGFDEGKIVGKGEGYNEGLRQSNNMNWLALFSALFDAPVKVLSGLLNFNFLGFNLWNLFTAILSISIVIFVSRFFIRR